MSRDVIKRDSIKRVAAIAVLATVAVAMSGCSFFRKDAAGYQLSAEQRPLEIPPDLDIPDTSAAMTTPAQPHSVTRSSMGTSPAPAGTTTASANATGFNTANNRDDTFNAVGAALEAIEGVTIASRAQLLSVYDVSYGGSDFLVRVTQTNAGSYVSAVDPRGLPATGAAPVKLIAVLQAALSR